MITFSRIFFVSLLLLMSACSSSHDNHGRLTMADVWALALRSGEAQKPFNPRKDITRAMIDVSKTPLILIETLESDYIATIQKAPIPTLADVWITTKGRSITTQNGLLTATRGFNHDMMGANTKAASAALKKAPQLNRPIKYTRSYKYLVADNKDEIINLHCKLSFFGHETIILFQKRYKTRKYIEHCLNDYLEFENIFWLQRNNTIRKSHQWHSLNIGMILIERLI